MIDVLGVIPARMGSSRFPGKPILPIDGKPMIWHVWQRSKMSGVLDDLVIATCDPEIKECAESFGAKVVMTSSKHTRANDRVAEVAEKVPCRIILNIQGDEPVLHPQLIRDVVRMAKKNPKYGVVSPMAAIESDEAARNPHEMKVCFNLKKEIIYFSREAVPSSAVVKRQFPCYRQVPVIAFRSKFCIKLSKLKPTPLEIQEGTDLMRAIEYGMPVQGMITKFQSKGVDIPADVQDVERILETDPLYAKYRDFDLSAQESRR